MKFKKLSDTSTFKMSLLRPSSRENKTSNFKRSKSLRASVKLITKIRSHPYISTQTDENKKKINSNLSKYDENLQNMSRLRLSNEFEINLSNGLENPKKVVGSAEGSGFSKYSRDKYCVLKEEINEDEIPTENAYENLAFIDNSFDSTTDSFYHEKESTDLVEQSRDFEHIHKTSEKVKKSNVVGDSGLTVLMKDEPICRTHGWCTRAKINSAKQFFQSTKKIKDNILDRDGRQVSEHIDHRVSTNETTAFKMTKESKALNKYIKIQRRRTDSVEDRCMDVEGRNISCQILQENIIDAKSESSQAMEFWEGLGRRKALQRNVYQHDKLSSANANSIAIQSSYNIHLHVLFTAIEQGYIDRVRAILESSEVEVNSLNADGLSTLDVAVLNNNRLLAKMLITFGAQEGNQFKSADALKSHLSLLLSESERRLQELGGTSSLEPSSSQAHRGSFSSQHGNLAGCGGSATEDKQLASWERRARALKRMLATLEQTALPDVPQLVRLDVTGSTRVTAKFYEADLADSAICTKFKLQWSFSEDFSEICGERVVLDIKSKECNIQDLARGRKYFFRAAAGNIKGYSQFVASSPAYLVPSSWRDVDMRAARFEGRLEQLDHLFCELRGAEFCQPDGPALPRRNHKKKTTIKQLFTASSKFQKNLRRGIYLSCVLYHEDKILVTNEDFLPVIEIDETYPSFIHQEFHWLMRVASSWDDVKSLKQDMEKSQGSSTNHFRMKMLQAATQMQTALCIQDLGQLYHKPIRDVQGTLVFSSVKHVRSSKMVSMLNSKWLPLSKIIKKLSVHEESNVADILMASIQDQVKYHQVSSVKLSRGLYLGYFKLQSSVDSIQVVVPAKSPNILPHCRVRDNPHVSADEWQHLGSIVGGGEETAAQASEQQRLFIDALAATAKRLFGYMDTSAEEALNHRIYTAELIELSADVSLVLMVPPFESACSPPGSREILLKRGDFLSLPIQVFEMIHFATYQPQLASRHARLSCILELDTAQAQHSHREAFSTSELSLAKDKLERLKDFQSQMNTVWKSARWLIDVITFARDKASAGVCVRHLASLERSRSQHQSCNNLKRSLLQLPPRDPKLVKASPGRGSWPGPSANDSSYSSDLNLLSAELSKSEQQLPMMAAQYSRKGSATSHCSSASEPCKPLSCQQTGLVANLPLLRGNLGLMPNSRQLPPSKSEDTLALGKYRHLDRSTSASATSSPLLSLKPVSNTTSESIQSISSSDECPPPPAAKHKTTKPAASVAAISDRKSTATENQQEEGAIPHLLPGILQVYAAYETGLASGTSLKLHVTPRTTAREVVDLVVKQLNMAVVLKGLEGPVYSPDDLSNFCLVAVIGARERCLRDDFKPLQLQNPWKKGRLYVRQKQDVLAALEHSSKHSAYL